MILAIDNGGGLYLFSCATKAERKLEAIDVQDLAIEFCDEADQRYIPEYSRPPKYGRFSVDNGKFKLIPLGSREAGFSETMIGRARHTEHSDMPKITNI